MLAEREWRGDFESKIPEGERSLWQRKLHDGLRAERRLVTLTVPAGSFVRYRIDDGEPIGYVRFEVVRRSDEVILHSQDVLVQGLYPDADGYVGASGMRLVRKVGQRLPPINPDDPLEPPRFDLRGLGEEKRLTYNTYIRPVAVIRNGQRIEHRPKEHFNKVRGQGEVEVEFEIIVKAILDFNPRLWNVTLR